MPRHAREAVRFPQIAAIAPVAVQTLAIGPYMDFQIETHGLERLRPGSYRQFTPVGGGPGGVLDGEDDLRQRMTILATDRIEPFHQDIEGQILMLEGAQYLHAHALECVTETLDRPKIGPQDQGVDETADQILQRTPAPIGDRGGDGDVRLTTVAHEPDLKGRQQQHETGGSGRPRERVDGVRQLGLQMQPVTSSTVAGPGRTRTVGG